MFIVQNSQFKNRQHTFAFNVDQQIDQRDRDIDTLIDDEKIKKIIQIDIDRLRFARRSILIQKKNDYEQSRKRLK